MLTLHLFVIPVLLLVGRINEERLKELLMTMGDRFSEEQVDEMFREAPIKEGLFDYLEFTRIIKHGAKQTVEDPNRVWFHDTHNNAQ